MTTPQLATVADNLRTLVGAQPGWAQSSLPRGTRIVYQRTEDGTTRLALAREDGYPAADELDRVRTAFRIPASAEPEFAEHRSVSQKTNRPIRFYRVQFKFID
jgi:hypothetical protein